MTAKSVLVRLQSLCPRARAPPCYATAPATTSLRCWWPEVAWFD